MFRSEFDLFKERISLRYDADELVDMLQLTTIDIVDAFEDVVRANAHLFEDCLDNIEEENDE